VRYAVNPHAARGGSYSFKNCAYYFCSPKCRDTFRANPEASLRTRSTNEPSNAAPKIHLPDAPADRADRPGDCPICGMALEPRTASLQDQEDPRAEPHVQKVLGRVALSVPLLAISMGTPIFGSHPWAEFALATPVVLWGGWPFFERGARSLVTRNLKYVYADRAGNGRGLSL